MQSMNKRDTQLDIGVIDSKDKEFKYKFGIIDFLTDYNASKKLETTWNNMRHWNQKDEISC